VRTGGEKYLRPIFANPDSRSILCATVWEFHPFRSFFKRVVRLAPHDRHSGTDFLATNRRKSKKARILAGEEFDFRELLKCYSGFGERNDLANATSVARFAKQQISPTQAVRFSRWL